MATGIIIQKRFFWNIEGKVGPGGLNKPEDVELVQLGYLSLGANPGAPADLKAICARVVPGAAYTGKQDDPLTVAIKAHERGRGGTQDGVVSPIHGASGLYDGKITFILIALNNNISDAVGASWPRLEAHPRCPGLLKGVSVALFNTRK